MDVYEAAERSRVAEQLLTLWELTSTQSWRSSNGTSCVCYEQRYSETRLAKVEVGIVRRHLVEFSLRRHL